MVLRGARLKMLFIMSTLGEGAGRKRSFKSQLPGHAARFSVYSLADGKLMETFDGHRWNVPWRAPFPDLEPINRPSRSPIIREIRFSPDSKSLIAQSESLRRWTLAEKR
jgi:hypothetical protein